MLQMVFNTAFVYSWRIFDACRLARKTGGDGFCIKCLQQVLFSTYIYIVYTYISTHMLDIDCGQATDGLKANPKYQLEIGSHTNISSCLSGLRYKVSPRFVVNFGRSSEPSMLAFFLGGPSKWEF